MARLPRYAKQRKNGFRQTRKANNVHDVTTVSTGSKINYSMDNCYPREWFKRIFHWLLHLPQVLNLFVTKLYSYKTIEPGGRRTKTDVDERIKFLESNLDDCMGKIRSLEMKIDTLTKLHNDQHQETHQAIEELKDCQTSLNANMLSLKQKETFQNIPVCIPAPPPPPPPPPALPPAFSNTGNLRSITSQLKSSNNAPKPRPVALTPRPVISLEDLTRVKLKKTPCVQRKERNEANPRISLEALRSVKLRKTNFENSRTSPRNAKSPKCRVNSRLTLRRNLTDVSPRTTPPKNNFCSSLFGEDLTPIITCALKKRFDALNYSFEEEKENQEPFFF